MNKQHTIFVLSSREKLVPLIVYLKSLGYETISIREEKHSYLVEIDRMITIEDLYKVKRRF